MQPRKIDTLTSDTWLACIDHAVSLDCIDETDVLQLHSYSTADNHLRTAANLLASLLAVSEVVVLLFSDRSDAYNSVLQIQSKQT